MTEHEQPIDDPALDAFLADAIFGIDSELDEDMAAPDLAAVLDLAQEMDPNAVPPGWIEEAAQLAPVISLTEGRQFRITQNDPAMAAVVAQVRAAMDHEVGVELAQRSGWAGVPSNAPVATTEVVSIAKPRQSRRGGWYLGMAAAVMLLVGGAGLISAQLVQRSEAERVPDTAVSERLSEPEVREAELREAKKTKKAAVTPEPAVEPEPEPVEEVEEVEEPETVAKPKRRAKESRQEKLERLDREAHAAWKAGDLTTARSKFERIVDLGRRHRLADLAYGDLFTLARRSGDTSRESKLWKKYLKRFPSGRFADDARAGLCRRASDSKKEDCWQDYLRDMPRGAYRAQAQRELKGSTESK